jgi:O-antigen biosynthesis protein
MQEKMQPEFSVIIVSYNVEHFLGQCLHSIYKAAPAGQAEAIVIDNASADGSVFMIETKFPGTRLIKNTRNKGFAAACNQGIEVSAGRYCLLLNPDTVLPEHFFSQLSTFFSHTPNAGAIGVRMLDGAGAFLPESKRCAPAIGPAFLKLFGMQGITAGSKKASRYYAEHIGQLQDSPVEVLSGACMAMRSGVLESIGGLDDSFFMYGEDIDLSMRIMQAGYGNYYLGSLAIIHYKGESTVRGSISHIWPFYRSMSVYAAKHIFPSKPAWYKILVNTAIKLRGAAAYIAAAAGRMLLPLSDFAASYISMAGIAHAWAAVSGASGSFPAYVYTIFLPVYSLSWVASVYFAGGYRQFSRTRFIIAAAISIPVFLSGYSLLGSELRFSRAVFIAGFFAAPAAIYIARQIYLLLSGPKPAYYSKSIYIAASSANYQAIASILSACGLGRNIAGGNKTTRAAEQRISLAGILYEAKKLKANEIIIPAEEYSYADIISSLPQISAHGLRLRLYNSRTSSIIGSDSSTGRGTEYCIGSRPLTSARERRHKRQLDIAASAAMAVLLPLLLVLGAKLSFIGAIWKVAAGKKTWVGYSNKEYAASTGLPELKPWYFASCGPGLPPDKSASSFSSDKIYASNYSQIADIKAIIEGFWNVFGRK